MSNDTLQVISEYLKRIAARDVEGASEYFADDFTGHALGQSKLAGDHDQAAMKQVLQDFLKGREITVEPVDVMASDSHGAAVVRVSVPAAVGGYSGLRVVLYKVSDGKIHELWVFDENQRAFDAAIDNP